MANILIVEARFYDHLNDLLLQGARAAIEAAVIATRPSPSRARSKSRRGCAGGGERRYDAFVAIGVVIRGETYHFEIVAGRGARAG